MITWSPWNPVAIKKVAPYTLSAIVNGASMYSASCNIVKYLPKVTVIIRAWMVSVREPSIRLWWAQVTVTPEANSTAVFNKGTLKGLIGIIPVGGHLHPSSGVGASLLWKKAQKKAKKNKISDAINNTIPHRSPFVTKDVWCPRKTLSRTTSRHHWIIVNKIISKPKIKQVVPYLWNHEVRPIVKINAPKEPVIGHGLNSTRWNGCRTMAVGYALELAM